MQHKQIYEIDRIVVQKRFEQIQFSVKVHGHLRILIHLVNNLVESEDNVELVDTSLKMPDFKSLTSTLTTRYLMNKSDNGEVRTNADTDQKGMDKFYEIIKNENKKIEEHINRGEQNTEFLKEVFNKMFDALQNKESFPPKIINELQCPHCTTQQKFGMTQPFNKHPSYSMYVPNEGMDPNMQSVRSLKNELDDMRNEVKRLYEKKQPQQNSEMNDLIQKLMEQKADNEDELRVKTKKIKQLIKELKKAHVELDELKEKLKTLFQNNRTLEELVRDLMSDQTQGSGETEKEELRSNVSTLKNQIDSLNVDNLNLRNKIQDLQDQLKRKNDQGDQNFALKLLEKEKQDLISQLNDLENEKDFYQKKNEELIREMKMIDREEDVPKYNKSDFLKCIYAQAHYLESEQQFSAKRQSQRGYVRQFI